MKQYVVNAFTEKVFEGNSAAVCVMNEWISDELMMNITRENNLSGTAFSVKEEDGYKLRCFIPGGETGNSRYNEVAILLIKLLLESGVVSDRHRDKRGGKRIETAALGLLVEEFQNIGDNFTLNG